MGNSIDVIQHRFPRRAVRAGAVFLMILCAAALLQLTGCRTPWDGSSGGTGGSPHQTTSPIDGTTTTTEAVTRRPLAVMIENSPSARPQSGLPEASVVYEAITEGGITRFMAIFLHGAPAVIGPVRSIRPHFIDLAREYDAVMVHCGQSYEALQILAKTPSLYNLDQLKFAKPFWRDSSRKAPHNLYTATEKLRAFVALHGWEQCVLDLPHFTSSEQMTAGDPAPEVNIGFGGVVRYALRLVYDPQQNVYLRYMDGVQHTDRETGQPITAKNIIIQRVEAEQFSGSKLHTYDVRVIGSGNGTFITGGKQMPMLWSKDAATDCTRYTDTAGRSLPFQAGQTWIEIVPATGSVCLGPLTPAPRHLDHGKRKKYNTHEAPVAQ